MTEEPKDIEVVDAELDKPVSSMTVKDMMMLINRQVVHVVKTIDEKNYSATVTQRTETEQLPDAVTAAIDIDPKNISKEGFNRDLDIKGYRSPAALVRNKWGRFVSRFARMKDYHLIENKVVDDNGNIVIEEEDADLMEHDLNEEAWAALSLNGHQMEAHRRNMAANAGNDFDADKWNNIANIIGIRTKNKKDVYPKE